MVEKTYWSSGEGLTHASATSLASTVSAVKSASAISRAATGGFATLVG